jgi:hypothetical protein
MVSKINSFATSCYKIMLGLPRLDKLPNENVLAEVNQRDLVNSAYKRQLNWLGQALRRDTDEPARISALYAGRSPRTFYDHIPGILSHSGISAQKIVETAKNEKE